MTIIDLSDSQTVGTLDRFRAGDTIDWRGHRFVITDICSPVPGYEQLLLRWSDRAGLPLSVSAMDLADAALVSAG